MMQHRKGARAEERRWVPETRFLPGAAIVLARGARGRSVVTPLFRAR
jgi:hypothetical protein